MASSKISVIIDVAVDQANRGLKSFRQSIQDADGAAGKFKAGTGAAFDAVKANAGALALGAGTALISFGAKAVGAFQDTALEAGKLSDSLGLTTEEASRLMEVSGDLGIGLGALETSLGKMNLAAARTPGEFEKIGASIAKNLDGTTNVQQTFLNAVDAINKIPDATDRANAASRIFGKGWREISELIGRGSDELKRNLEDVAGAKVISEQDVADAREFRDTFDELGDVGSDALVGIGGQLVPVLSLISKAVVKTTEWKDALVEATNDSDGNSFFGNIKENLSWFVTNIKEGRSPLEAFGGGVDDVEASTSALAAQLTSAAAEVAGFTAAEIESNSAVGLAAKVAEDAADAQKELEDKTREAADAINDLNEAVLESIDSSLAYRNQQADTNATIRDTSIKMAMAKQGSEEYSAAAREQEGAVLDLAAAAVAQAEDTAAAAGETLSAKDKTAIYKAELEKMAGYLNGDAALAIAMHIDRLNKIPGSINTNFSFNTANGFTRNQATNQRVGRNARGTKNWRGGPTWVGEDGAEIIDLPTGTEIIDASQSRRIASGGVGTTVINLTVNAGLGTNGAQVGRQIVDVLEAHYRNGGRPPRSG